MAIWAADVCSRAARQLICIEPTGLRLRHIGKTDPRCGTVQFCFHSGRLTCSARTGFRAATTPSMSRDWTAVSRCCMQVREARSSDDEAVMKLGVHAYEDAIDKYVTARYSRIARHSVVPWKGTVTCRGVVLKTRSGGRLKQDSDKDFKTI